MSAKNRTPGNLRQGSLGIWAILALLSVAIATGVSSGQDASSDIAKKVHEFADKEVDQYRFVNQEGKDVFERVPRSLLRWSNATSYPAYGDTYVWTEKGCARAIISIFAIGAPRNTIAAECQSLSETPFSMRRGNDLVWTPKESGIEFKPTQIAGAPAGSPTARGVQMNRIARAFRAEFSPHTTPDDFTQLRLLARPMYRYQSKDPKIVDGAIYGFVNSTDPEMLLVIEARKIDGEIGWYYSPARSRHDPIRVYLKDQLVWDVPRLAPPWNMIRNPNGIYFNLRLERIADPEWLRASEGE